MDREKKYTLGITLSFARELTNRPFLSLISVISLRQGYFQTNPFPSCHVPAYSVELPGPSLTVSTVFCQGQGEGVFRDTPCRDSSTKRAHHLCAGSETVQAVVYPKPKLPTSSMLLAKHRKVWGEVRKKKTPVC